MRRRVLGATLVAAGMVFHAMPASADKLDDVLKRLDKIEKKDAALANENAALRKQLNKRDAAAIKNATPAKPGATPLLATRVPTPAPALVAPEIDAQGHGFLEHKKGNPLTFYTPGGEITGYGNIDVSIDDTAKAFGGNVNNNPAYTGASEPAPRGNMGWMPALSSNSSYLGVRGFQRLPDFPANFVYQLEVGFGVTSTPSGSQSNSSLNNNAAALFNRNTWIGFANPEWGAVKIGKTNTPYDRSTGGFNPFSGEIGSMNVIMGNTGGDNRVEFSGRLDHSIWYESPTIGGFQWNALFSPGQNRSTVNDNIAGGESQCTGNNDPTSGGDLPVTCSDGSFGNAVSGNLSYTNGPLYLTAAAEWHSNVNRQSDIAAIYGIANSGLFTNATSCGEVQAFAEATGVNPAITPGSTASANFLHLCNEDVANEWAWKVGALYTFATKTTVGAIFESLHRDDPADLQFINERQRNGTWFFVTQQLTPNDSASFGWAHAFAANGDPGQHNSASLTTADGAATYAPNDNSADMLTANYKHKFGPNLTWYSAVAMTINSPSAHYDMGAGHGITTDCHSAYGASGGLTSNPHCWTGNTLAGVSTGLQWRF